MRFSYASLTWTSLWLHTPININCSVTNNLSIKLKPIFSVNLILAFDSRAVCTKRARASLLTKRKINSGARDPQQDYWPWTHCYVVVSDGTNRLAFWTSFWTCVSDLQGSLQTPCWCTSYLLPRVNIRGRLQLFRFAPRDNQGFQRGHSNYLLSSRRFRRLPINLS